MGKKPKANGETQQGKEKGKRKSVLDWIREKKKRDILAFLGVGIAAIVGGVWAVFVFVHTREDKGSVTYDLCIGPKNGKKWCPGASRFVPDVGPNTVANWAKKECAKYRQEKEIYQPTRECPSCYVVKVVCKLF
jgi:hypothetical protein